MISFSRLVEWPLFLRERHVDKPRCQLGDGRRENVLDPLGERKLHRLMHRLRQFTKVFLIGLGKNDPSDARAMGCQHLFFDSANRQD